MNKLILLSLLILLDSCTYTITLVHTEGQASDVVDETTTSSTDVSPSLEIPGKII